MGKKGRRRASSRGRTKGGGGYRVPWYYRHEVLIKRAILCVLALLLAVAGGFGFHQTYWDSALRFRHGLMLKKVPVDTHTLIGAIYRENQPLVWNLLKAGISPDTRLEGADATVLMLAVDRGHTEIVKTLLENGANASATDATGLSPLEIAVNQGNLPIARYLRHYGATNQIGLEGALKLGEADYLRETIREIRKEQARKLSLEKGLLDDKDTRQIDQAVAERLNSRDEHGLTPLIWSILQDNALMVEILLKAGADPNLADARFRQTPLFLAIERGHESLVQYLILHGADTDLRDEQGRTPLIWAVIHRNPGIISAILTKKPDVNQREKQLGMTALSIAAMSGNRMVSQWLLEAGADPLIRDNQGRNALDWAVMSDSGEMVETIINARLKAFRENPGLIKNAETFARKNDKAQALNILLKYKD